MFRPFSSLSTGRTVACSRPSGSGNERKKIKRKRTGQDFLLFSLFHFLRAQFSFLSFIFSALGFLFTCSDQLGACNNEGSLGRETRWNTLEEARALKLFWAPPVTLISSCPPSKELIVLHQSDLMSIYNRVATKGRGGFRDFPGYYKHDP